jgi:cytochrome c oxidase subunit II
LSRLTDRRTVLIAAAAAAVLMLAAAPAALGSAVTPQSGGSPNAGNIDTLYKITLYIAIVIFLIVEGTLAWSLLRFRVRRRGPSPAQIHGNTPLELGWTLGAALILVLLMTVTFVYLSRIKNPPASGPNGLRADAAQLASIDQATPPPTGGPSLDIKVNGQQYIWRYQYPGPQPLFSFFEMVVPTNTTVTLDITSSDVAHSWWIPKLGGKADAIPGYTNHTWFKISKPGVYRGQCAELCGENHADMLAQVRAVPPDQYEAWTRRQHADILASQKALSKSRAERLRTGQIQ